MSQPIIAVVGGLSKQGSSIVHSLLQSGRYSVRAITKRIDSPDAKQLESLGVEVIQADSTKREDLERAFKGAYGVFSMTPGTSGDDPSVEIALGKMQADAAVSAGVKHLIFSSIDGPEEEATKKYPHLIFPYRAEVEAYIRTLPIIRSFISLAYFYTNWIEYYRPQLQDGVWVFSLPLPNDSLQPYTDSTTAPGPVVLAMFDNPQEFDSQSVPIVSDMLTGDQIAQTFAKVTGQKAKFVTSSKEDFLAPFSQFPLVGLRIYEMFLYSVEFGYFRKDRDLEWSRRIYPKALTYEQFLRKTEWKGESWEEFNKKSK